MQDKKQERVRLKAPRTLSNEQLGKVAGGSWSRCSETGPFADCKTLTLVVSVREKLCIAITEK